MQLLAPKSEAQLRHALYQSSASERKKDESFFLEKISKFIRENKINIEINYLGYDSLPDSLIIRGDNYMVTGYHFNNEPREKHFVFAATTISYHPPLAILELVAFLSKIG